MTFDEILEKFKAEDPKIILDALEELSQASSNAAAETQRALKAYKTNAEEKSKTVSARLEELKEQRDKYQEKIEALKKPLVSATVAGNQQKLENIKKEMRELGADMLQVSTEIEMLENTHMSGDEELYNTVLEKSAIHAKLRAIYLAAKKKVYELAVEKIKSYEKIQHETYNYDLGGGYGVNIDELKRDFHFEKYAKLEEQTKKENAAREADTEKARHTFYFGGSRPPAM